ncbi:MAG: hypothetical protein WA209_11485, partial [Candidatus Acidiferrales bacterium]
MLHERGRVIVAGQPARQAIPRLATAGDYFILGLEGVFFADLCFLTAADLEEAGFEARAFAEFPGAADFAAGGFG